MPESTVSIRSNRFGTRYSLPFDATRFAQRFGQVTQDVVTVARRAFIREFHSQIRKVVVPELRRRTPVRTGTLKRSTRYRQLGRDRSAIIGRFYGAYVSPSQRAIAQDVFLSRRASILSACINAARRAVEAIL